MNCGLWESLLDGRDTLDCCYGLEGGRFNDLPP